SHGDNDIHLKPDELGRDLGKALAAALRPVKPIAFAVLRLITSSNFVGCSTGRAADFVPCRILCTRAALRRNRCGTSAAEDIRPPARGYDRSTAADGRRYLIAKSAMVLAKKTAWTTTACACLLAMAANAASTSLASRTIATGPISTSPVCPARCTC